MNIKQYSKSSYSKGAAFVAAALAVCSIASVADAQRTSTRTSATSELTQSPATTLPSSVVRTVDGKPLLEVTGRDDANPLSISVAPQQFIDRDELFTFLEQELGAEIVRDKSGNAIGATGKVTTLGNVVFNDAGQDFVATDFVSAYLGGRDGVIEVGSQMVAVNANAVESDPGTNYFAQTENACVGESCVRGHSWLTHLPLYHSVGVRTEQTSGGTRTVYSPYCTSGVLVYISGEPKCRVRSEECEWDPEIKACIPVPGSDYLYLEPRYRSSEVYSNQLFVGGLFLTSPQGGDYVPKSVFNRRTVETSGWAIGSGSVIADIIGVCGWHSSSAGGSVRTSDGSTGDDDINCVAGF